MGIRVRRPTLGFVVAAAVLAVLVGSAGIDSVLEALRTLRGGRTLGVLLAVTLGWLATWGPGLRTVPGTLEITVSPRRAVMLYATAAFSNDVTPFGWAGGEPLAASLLSRATGARHGRCLAAVARAARGNFVSPVAFGLLGSERAVERFVLSVYPGLVKTRVRHTERRHSTSGDASQFCSYISTVSNVILTR